jgi:hypothetical protein
MGQASTGKADVAFEALDNGFRAFEDPRRLQREYELLIGVVQQRRGDWLTRRLPR